MVAPKPKVRLTCQACSRSFETFPYRAVTARYCSKACWSVRAGERTCRKCGTTFRPVSGGVQVYCSKSCANQRTGKLSPQWKGGVTQSNERAQLGDALRQWRLAVFRRDNYRCRKCGATADLHAHHVLSFADHPSLRLAVDNGLTVCIDCHGAIHGKDFRRRLHRHCQSCSARLDPRTKGQECKRCVLSRGDHLALNRRSHQFPLIAPARR